MNACHILYIFSHVPNTKRSNGTNSHPSSRKNTFKFFICFYPATLPAVQLSIVNCLVFEIKSESLFRSIFKELNFKE